MDVAKRLLDYGFHAPHHLFPLAGTRVLADRAHGDGGQRGLGTGFCDAMASIREEMRHDAEKLKLAPHTMPVRRLDDVRAAKQLDLMWKGLTA